MTVGSLDVQSIVDAKDFALAEAAKPFLGQAGFTLIAIAAMLSTASAINATLYGSARLSYAIAKDGELPAQLERKVWGRPVEGLLITAAITVVIANVLDLGSIATIGSAGFLIVFGAVNAAAARRAGNRRARLDRLERGRGVRRRSRRADLADHDRQSRAVVGPCRAARPGSGRRGSVPAVRASAAPAAALVARSVVTRSAPPEFKPPRRRHHQPQRHDPEARPREHVGHKVVAQVQATAAHERDEERPRRRPPRERRPPRGDATAR